MDKIGEDEMPLRHGIHHGISFIVGIFLSVLLGELFRKAMPGFLPLLIIFLNFLLILSTSLSLQTRCQSWHWHS